MAFPQKYLDQRLSSLAALIKLLQLLLKRFALHWSQISPDSGFSFLDS
jgi:hypothetical protein